jgi:hypothetical protein
MSTVICMGIFVISEGLAFGGEVQGLSAGAVDGCLVVGGLVVTIAAAGLVVFGLVRWGILGGSGRGAGHTDGCHCDL